MASIIALIITGEEYKGGARRRHSSSLLVILVRYRSSLFHLSLFFFFLIFFAAYNWMEDGGRRPLEFCLPINDGESEAFGDECSMVLSVSDFQFSFVGFDVL